MPATVDCTFDDIDMCADISLLDDYTSLLVVDRVHSVDDLLYLTHVQVLHEIVVQNSFSQ